MSDFRIQLPDETDKDYDLEIDWDEKLNKWTLSEREKGLGHAWLEKLPLSDMHIVYLYDFFRISSDVISPHSIITINPGELVRIHAKVTNPITLYANKCTECGLHWEIYRWDDIQKNWLIFGRSCDFLWKRGDQLNNIDEKVLKDIRGSLAAPLL